MAIFFCSLSRIKRRLDLCVIHYSIVQSKEAGVKIGDIISLWSTNIMQMYGDAESVDGAPVAEVRCRNFDTF